MIIMTIFTKKMANYIEEFKQALEDIKSGKVKPWKKSS